MTSGESEASGLKSLNSKGYIAMQTRIAATKKKKEQHCDRAQAAGKPAKISNTTKRVKTPSGTQGPVEKDDKRGRALTDLLAQALHASCGLSGEHFDETEYPKKSDCTALIPLSTKLAKVYEPCSILVRQTELMEGLGSTYSQNYDIRPKRKESLIDGFTKVLYGLEWCDMQFQDVENVMAILKTCE